MSFNPTSKTHFKDETKKPATDSSIKRILYSIVGTLMLVLGIIGMLVTIHILTFKTLKKEFIQKKTQAKKIE